MPASSENIDEFHERGFTVVRDFLTAGEVAAARAACDERLLTDTSEETEIPAGDLLQMDEFSDILFSEANVRALSTVLGGPIGLYPNYVVRLNRYTTWHVDNGFLSSFHDDTTHLRTPEFQHAQCMVYFQDNDLLHGGGLDVRAGSHRYVDDGLSAHPLEILAAYPEEVSIDSKAGDLVLIDGRIMHRGTPAKEEPAQRKYGLFFSASRQNERLSSRYIGYLNRRSSFLREKWKMEDTSSMAFMLKRYDDVLDVRYPDSFRPSDVSFAERNGLELYSM